MSGFPLRSLSNASQRPSGDTSNPSITWLPVVTGRASEIETGESDGIGIFQTFEVSENTEYTRRLPSADKLMAEGLSPVVSLRDASRLGPPDSRLPVA